MADWQEAFNAGIAIQAKPRRGRPPGSKNAPKRAAPMVPISGRSVAELVKSANVAPLVDHVEWVRKRVAHLMDGKGLDYQVEQEPGRERVELSVADIGGDFITGQIAFITVQQMRDKDETGMHESFFKDRLNDFISENVYL